LNLLRGYKRETMQKLCYVTVKSRSEYAFSRS
jgi:hypothetical protein